MSKNCGMYYLLITHFDDGAIATDWLSYFDYTDKEIVEYARATKVMVPAIDFIEIVVADERDFGTIS